MSYNTELQNNNADLRAILDAVNNLPEAGSGSGGSGTIETCTLQFVYPNGNDVNVSEILIPFVRGGNVEYDLRTHINEPIEGVVVGNPIMILWMDSVYTDGFVTSIDGGIVHYDCYSGVAMIECTRTGTCTVTFEEL